MSLNDLRNFRDSGAAGRIARSCFSNISMAIARGRSFSFSLKCSYEFTICSDSCSIFLFCDSCSVHLHS